MPSTLRETVKHMKPLDESEQHRITWDCKQATFLIEKQQVSRLTATEKRDLEYHLAGCDNCITYKKQSTLLGKLFRKLTGARTGPIMSSKDKDAIQQAINSRLKD